MLNYLGGVTVFGIGLALYRDKTASVAVPQIGQNCTNWIGKTCADQNREIPFLFSIYTVERPKASHPYICMLPPGKHGQLGAPVHVIDLTEILENQRWGSRPFMF